MNKENVKKYVRGFFKSFSGLIKKTSGAMGKMNMTSIGRFLVWARKFVAVSIMAIAGMLILIKTVWIILITADPIQFEKILNSFFGLNIFDYINLKEYYTFFAGDYLLDISFLSLFIVFGVWVYNQRNLLKSFKIRILLLSGVTIGAMLTSFGIFYALPEIKEPILKIRQEFQKKHALCHDYEKKSYRHNKNHKKRDQRTNQSVFEQDTFFIKSHEDLKNMFKEDVNQNKFFRY